MDIDAGVTDELPAGKMKVVQNGGKSILIANVDGNYYAIGNVCTHKACSLSEGKMSGQKVECPCHGSMFDLKDGSVKNGPAENPEPTYKVRTENGKVFIALENRVYA